MCGGGGGGGGTTQYNWNDTLAPYWASQLSYGKALEDRPYEQYSGQRIANLNQDQQSALGATENYDLSGGSPATQAANGELQQTLDGNYLNGPQANPYGTAANPYMGEGPAFQDMLKGSNDEITRAYNQGTDADTTRMFNLAGAFGGSAHQTAVSNNEHELAKQLATNTSNLENTQFDRSGNLYEGAIGRANTDFENERQRQQGAVAGGQNEQALAMQRFQSLMGAGDVQRGLQQDYLNQGYQDWLNQRNYPYTQSDYFSGLLSRAQGGVSPNVSTQQSGYSASPFSQLLGGGLLAYGLSQ